MPASAFAPSLGDDGATIDSADAFDLSLLSAGGASPAAGPCAAPSPGAKMSHIGMDADGRADASSSPSTTMSETRAVAQHVELKMRNAELQSSHDLLLHAHRLKEEECESLRASEAAVVEERDAAFERVRELRRVLRQFQKNATEFSMQRARLRVEVERLQEENDRLKRNHKKTEEERDRLQESYEALVSSLDHLKTTTEQLTKERDELKTKLGSQEHSDQRTGTTNEPAEQQQEGSWIESFRLPIPFLHHEVEDKTKIPNESTHGGATPDTSCSWLSFDERGNPMEESRKEGLSKNQGWFSFRRDRSHEDDGKNTHNEPCPNISSEKDNNQVDKNSTRQNKADSQNHQSSEEPRVEVKSDGGSVDDALEHKSNKCCNEVTEVLKKESQTKESNKRHLTRAKSDSTTNAFHHSWCPESSSDLAPFCIHKGKARRSQSLKECGSVRNLFSKEPGLGSDGEDACIILREGAFESAAASSSCLDRADRRLVWPFKERKGLDEEGEIGDADEGNCNAIIQREQPSPEKNGKGCQSRANETGKPGGFLWRRHSVETASAESSKGVEGTIIRRRSNGDFSLGSLVAITS